MSSEDIVPLLKQLGLNLYESEAYVALLTKGELSAKELGQLTSIPLSRTYDVLSSLREKGFALITPSSDKIYAPIDAATVLSLLYGRKKKEIQSEMIRVQEETEQRLEKFYAVFSQAKELLASVARERTQITNQPVFVIEGNQSIENSMLSLVDKAEKELLRITKPPDSRRNMLDPFYFVPGPMLDHLVRARKRGVKVRTLSLAYEIPSLVGIDYRDEEGNERRYLEKDEDIPEKFILVDGSKALLNLRDPVSKTFGSIGLLLESQPTGAILGEHFESMWNKAETLASVSSRVKVAVEEVLAGMKKTAGFSRFEISIFRVLSKYGALSVDSLSDILGRYHSPEEVAAAVERLLRSGLLIRNDWLKAVMVENPTKVKSLISAAKNAADPSMVVSKFTTPVKTQ